jgi:Cytochrome c7 and related cytochrome c
LRPGSLRTHAALAACLLAVACFACGGGAGGAAPPQVAPAPGASGEPAAPAASAALPGGGVQPAPSGSAASGPLGPPAVAVDMKSPISTAMVDDLKALGLDAKNLPPIEKLEPRALRGVMKIMAKSLGVRCGDCHQEGDFAAPTRRKKIAAHMWDEFAVKLSLGDGQGQPAPLFCDSCHQGRTTLLDRRDKKALSKWMDDNFASKLQRKDGKSEECESCHVDMEMHFLAQWGQ